MRADRLDDETLDLLEACDAVVVTSLETPNFDFARQYVRKGLVPARVTDLARRCHRRGLPLRVHYIVGVPGETAADVNRTLAFALHLWDRYGAYPLVQVATPIPGTRMEREARRAGYVRLPPEQVAAELPVLFQSRSVLQTPHLAADTVTRMYQGFLRHVMKGHPRELTIVPGYACNNRCPHCLVAGLSAPRFDLARARRRMVAARRRGIDVVVVEGGEPTIFPETLAVVRLAREVGMREVMMETNGRMLAYPAYARALARSGLTMLFVTVHGHDAATHERVTRVPGSFAQVVQGVRNLLQTGFANVAVNVPIHRHLVRRDGLRRTVAFWAAQGVRRFMLQYLSPFGGFRGKVDAVVPYDVALPAVRALLDDPPEGVRLRVMNVPFCMLPGHEDHVHPDVNNAGTLPCSERGALPIVAMLAEGKVKDAGCDACAYGFLCTGKLPTAQRPAA